jgi:hypothetical protein
MVVVAVGLLATAGAAIATNALTNAYTDPGGVYHGCVNNGSGLLRAVVPGSACKAGETAIDWAQAGPQGPQGIQGPKGDKGAPGEPGAALAGSPCTLPSGAVRTVVMNVAATGEISFVCMDANGGGNPPPSEIFCNGVDDDQNGIVDDAQPVPHGFLGCVSLTVVLFCDPGWTSTDGSDQNGCETAVAPTRIARE